MFPGGKAGRPLSNMAMLKLLQRMGRRTASGGVTVHGLDADQRSRGIERQRKRYGGSQNSSGFRGKIVFGFGRYR